MEDAGDAGDIFTVKLDRDVGSLIGFVVASFVTSPVYVVLYLLLRDMPYNFRDPDRVRTFSFGR